MAGKPGKSGRRRYVPTPEIRAQVVRAAVVGWPAEKIAYFLGISEDTLSRYYREELDSPKEVEIELGNKVLEKARAGDVACLFFYLKTRCHWRETQRQEIEATLNLPPQIQVVIQGKKKGSA